MGLKTGANNFFLLNSETIARWQIEEEFLQPIVNSPREMRNLHVNSTQLPYQLFMCHELRNALWGTSVFEYIEWVESQGIHQRSRCCTRTQRSDVGTRPTPFLNYPLVIGSTVRTLYSTDGCYATNNFSKKMTHDIIDNRNEKLIALLNTGCVKFLAIKSLSQNSISE